MYGQIAAVLHLCEDTVLRRQSAVVIVGCSDSGEQRVPRSIYRCFCAANVTPSVQTTAVAPKRRIPRGSAPGLTRQATHGRAKSGDSVSPFRFTVNVACSATTSNW